MRDPRPSIYLADPDELFRRGLAESLRLCGVQVDAFSSGAELARRAHERQPDLILFASDTALEGGNVFARVKDARATGRCALVLVVDRNRPLPQLVGCVLDFLADWTRLYVRNLAGVLTWLQARERSGRLELKAFGDRGTIRLRHGEVVEARWKELRGRRVVEFLLEALPEVGFRFVEQGDGAEAASAPRLGAGPAALAPTAVPLPALTPVAAGLQRPLPGGRGNIPPPAFDRRSPTDLHLDLARALLQRGLVGEALVHLRAAEGMPGFPGEIDYLLGLAHLRSGDLETAREELTAADRALPGDERVRSALRQAAELATALRSLPRARLGSAALPARVATLSLGPARPSPPSAVGLEPSALAPAAPVRSSARSAAISSAAILSSGPPAAPTTPSALMAPPASSTDRVPAIPAASEVAPVRATAAELAASVVPATVPAPVLIEPAPASIEAAAIETEAVVDAFTAGAMQGTLTRGLGRWPSASRRVAVAAGVALGLAAAALLLEPQKADRITLVEPWDVRTAGAVARIGLEPVPTATPGRDEPAAAAAEPSRLAERTQGLPPESAIDLEALRGRPQSVPLDAQPRPRRMRDALSMRALIEPGSGHVEVIKAWGDTMRVEREVNLWVLVDASGAVRDVRTARSSGVVEVDARGFEAVRNVVYTPGRRGGVAVPAWVRQRVAFKLE